MQKSARRLVQAADVCVLDDGLIHGAMPRFGVEGAETTQEGRRWWESNPHTLIYFPPSLLNGAATCEPRKLQIQVSPSTNFFCFNGTAVCEPRKLPSSQILKKQVFAVP